MEYGEWCKDKKFVVVTPAWNGIGRSINYTAPSTWKEKELRRLTFEEITDLIFIFKLIIKEPWSSKVDIARKNFCESKLPELSHFRDNARQRKNYNKRKFAASKK